MRPLLGHLLLPVVALTCLVGCGSCAPETSAREAESSAPAPPPEATPDPDAVELVPAAPAIGSETAATYPAALALQANRRALALHRSGDYAASEAAFAQAVEADPSYLLARFNRACALARLGREQDALEILSSLLASDLPTFLPRLEADEDLATLREGPSAATLATLRAQLVTEYEAALRQGAPMVRVARYAEDDGSAHRIAQAGVWWAQRERFVPMGPALSQSRVDLGGPAVTETLLDAEHRIVIGLTGVGAQSEGGDYISGVHVYAYRAITGEAMVDERRPCVRGQDFCSLPHLHAIEGGVAVRFVDLENTDWEHPTHRVLAGEGAFDDAHLPQIVCDQEGCSVSLLPPSSARVTHGREAALRFEGDTEDRVYTLDAAHRWHRYYRDRSTFETLAQGEDVIWLATAERIYFDWVPGYGASAISRITRGEERALMVLGGRAVVMMQRGPDGSVYLQLGDHLERRATGSAEAETLPAGLALVASPHPGFGREIYRDE